MAARKKNFVCRVCGKKLPYAHSRKFPMTNTRVRYWKCGNCSARFKSTEKLVLMPPSR